MEAPCRCCIHHLRSSGSASSVPQSPTLLLILTVVGKRSIGRRTAPRRWRSRKFSRKFVEKIRFHTLFGRRGTSGKSRATRCQNSSLLRCLATPKMSKKRFGKNSIYFYPGTYPSRTWWANGGMQKSASQKKYETSKRNTSPSQEKCEASHFFYA